ncbi:DUF1353 domain-containing protein [Duganella dendranthematis]|uniref:DUF1353 domain-containing protein n=1 Tax=Duganella dendranthematis TaxID=2728021 RepID=A0ABX6M7J5_9BURK|nr:DUF1353 domain-containing protein [Duganella dendranthematis]QJD90153.1 DUF1353 domain-containing protein [Duganella dendranthematis]
MSNGRFSGNPRTEWLSESGPDQRMQLLEAFWYDDPNGFRWNAPRGSIINGASIPKTLWSSVGSPYTGDYRMASIVHDVACSNPKISRDDADRMFYQACLAGGCTLFQAKILYAGVCIGAATGDWKLRSPYLTTNDEKAFKLPSEHSQAEVEVRAKFILMAKDLESTGDDFEEVRQVVIRHLEH